MNASEYTDLAIRETFPNRTFNKLFGIGYNKTGTTSLETIFKLLGFRMPDQNEQELRVVKQLHLGNFKPLVELVDRYDAFQDQPFSEGECYAQVDALFPGSKFVLTVRDADAWFESLCTFHAKIWGVSSVRDFTEASFKDKTNYLYKNYIHDYFEQILTNVEEYKPVVDWSLLYDKNRFVETYKRRNDRIISYFRRRPGDLLVIDFEHERDIAKILEFLGYSQELNMALPHENRSR